MIKQCLYFIILLPLMLGIVSCKSASVSNLVNPTVSNTTGTWSGIWTIYDNEIKTGGTVMMYTTLQGQELDFNYTGNPHAGTTCIKYSWDGSDAIAYETGASQHGFVGFSLIVADSVSKYSSVSKNLVAAGYTKITFWVRGSLNSGVSLVVKGNNASTDVWTSNDSDKKITDNWQQFVLPIDTASLSTTRDFVRIVLTYSDATNTVGNGGTVYIDDIRLEK